MKAADCLREPGDVARRDSCDWVAIWAKDTGHCLLLNGTTVLRYFIPEDIPEWLPGDDWQPLHPAADHAAEVKRLTAERDSAQRVLMDCTLKHEAERKSLTARVAELEEELRDQGWMDSMCCCTGDCDHDSAHECLAWIRSQLDERCNSIREMLATAPLPTAGDEEKCGCCCGHGTMAGPGTMACPDCGGTGRHAPAEPDSPAEGPAKPSGVGERIHKAALDEPCWMHRDGEWTEAKFDPFCPHPQYRRAAEHRKPSCLDGVPAVLCEYRCDYTPAQRWWVYGAVVDGRVAGVQDGKTGRPAIWHLMYLTPIHHDAAAVELRGRIERWGGR